MKHDFWHNKWTKNEIGFHLAEANPLLVKHLPSLKLKPNSRIFLPLCGKTLDIHWLLAQGYHVVGAELSTIAVEALFRELSLSPNINQVGNLTQYSAPNITIWNGDIFELNQSLLGKVDAVYDRAALVALPLAMRECYTAHITAMTQNVQQLLVCFEYDQTQMEGPPFCVNADEVHEHYGDYYAVKLLDSKPLAGGLKGKVEAFEQVWHLVPPKLF
ncbi:thiopurine S-methyltransferase [Methylotenera sp.]|uniref:thiopurine S-methyltransferase n=1 Tax=Methylotenera sp. TaxID=2051956 RepID=UPI0024894BCA|nr:thiopurine S-methyltransferase [Methylotenera sp.]MDI1298346.1 thiopurine S-methyltransferase [Methylotenera sp.]